MSNKIIEMKNVNKWFVDFQVLKDIILEVQSKQKIVVCGPSGSGKSTLIRCINRLEEHQEDNIIVDGTELNENTQNIEQIRAEVGMVFQQFNLFPHLSILDNCTLAPIWVKKTSKKEAETQATNAFGHLYIHQRVYFHLTKVRVPCPCLSPFLNSPPYLFPLAYVKAPFPWF